MNITDTRGTNDQCKLVLIRNLKIVYSNFFVGLIGLGFLESGISIFIIRNEKISVNDVELDFSDMIPILKEREAQKMARGEFLKMLLRVFILESFEVIKQYCKLTGQNHIFRRAEWHDFASLIRDCCGHCSGFKFERQSRKKFPAKWRGKEITYDMHNKDLELSFFSWADAIELYNDMITFVKKELK